MTFPRSSGVDPQLVAALSGRLAFLGEHLRHVSGDLATLQAQLQAQPLSDPQPQPQQPRPQPQPQPRPLPQPMAPWQASGPQRGVPPRTAAQLYAQGAKPTREPVSPTQPWWQRDGVISRILAVAGAGVTLVGVVMLLVLAAQAGWLGPQLRVAGGTVLSIALLWVGSRIFATPGGRVGGIALAATGIAGLYLDVVAVTVVYGWLEPAIGLVVAFGITAAGVALAVSWRSQPMAALILVGVALCAPIVTGGIALSLIAFLTATFIAGFAAQLKRDWPLLGAARTLPVVIATLIGIAAAHASTIPASEVIALTAIATVIAAFGIGSAVELLRRNVSDTTATAMMGASAVPLLAVGTLLSAWTTTAIEGALALVCATVIATSRRLPLHAKAVLTLIASLALLHAVLAPTSIESRPLALLLVAAVLLVVAHRASSTPTWYAAAGFGALGSLGFLLVSMPGQIAEYRYSTADFGVVLAGIVLAGLAVAFVPVAARLEIVGKNLQAAWFVAGVVALYAATAATVALGVAAIGGRTGFVAGHCVATIEWMAAALALLALGLRSEKYAHAALLGGLSLTAASVAKLFLFDLDALDGLFRVGAFIVVGLLLLFAGTRYARVFAGRESASLT